MRVDRAVGNPALWQHQLCIWGLNQPERGPCLPICPSQGHHTCTALRRALQFLFVPATSLDSPVLQTGPAQSCLLHHAQLLVLPCMPLRLHMPRSSGGHEWASLAFSFLSEMPAYSAFFAVPHHRCPCPRYLTQLHWQDRLSPAGTTAGVPLCRWDLQLLMPVASTVTDNCTA